MPHRRLDAELVRRRLAPSGAVAAELLAAGRVRVDGFPVRKGAALVAAGAALTVTAQARRFVSRGGDKLDAALDELAIPVAGRRCFDVGASTGGFTDCLLARGAAQVVAIDVGYGLLHARLRDDPRVVVAERLHVRDADPGALGGAGELVVADLSFIALASVAPALARLGRPGADYVVLVKPQFEARRAAVGSTGVVRDPAVHRDAVLRAVAGLAAAGLGARAVVPSRTPGAKGNREFFVHARPGPEAEAIEIPSLAPLAR